MEGSVPIHHKPRTAKNNSFFLVQGNLSTINQGSHWCKTRL